jgi:TRAP-type C4-dicarboxylate transport system permease small subunit
VDLLVARFPKRAQSVIDGVGYGAALVTCIVISWQSFIEGLANREINRLSASLGIPIYPFYWVTALGFGVLCLALLVLIARAIRRDSNK